MIKQKKTPKIRALYIIWALPALVILQVAFAKPVYTSMEPNEDPTNITINEERNIQLSIFLKDINGDPVPGANAAIKGAEIGTISDENGKAVLNIAKSDVVIVSFVGFEKYVLDYNVITKKGKKNGKGYEMKLVMRKASDELSDEKKKELIKKKEAALKQKQIEADKSNGKEANGLMTALKEVEEMMKELSMKQKKLEEMENDESVDKTELAAKQKQLEVKMLELKKKRAAIEKELEKQK
jgi:hypothetical protein